MSLFDAAQLRNKIALSTLIAAPLIYLTLVIMSAGLILLILLITGGITYWILQNEKAAAATDEVSFRQRFPFARYGLEFGDFQHVFDHDADILPKLTERISQAVQARLTADLLQPVTITDHDPNLSQTEARGFLMSDMGTSARGTSMRLVVETRAFGHVQTVRWWIMLGGHVDRDKQLRFLLATPFTFWFWIIPYMRRNYNILNSVRSIYASSYNDFDLVARGRSVHQIVFDAMVEVLEEEEIDTSDIKMQRMQVMNINISGGKVQMGNVVQGSMNKVVSRVMGAAGGGAK